MHRNVFPRVSLAELNQVSLILQLLQLEEVSQVTRQARIELHHSELRLMHDFALAELLRVKNLLVVQDPHLKPACQVFELLFWVVNTLRVDRVALRVVHRVQVVARGDEELQVLHVCGGQVADDRHRILLVAPIHANHASVGVAPDLFELLFLILIDREEFVVIFVGALVVRYNLLEPLVVSHARGAGEPPDVARVILQLLVEDAFEGDRHAELVPSQVQRILERAVRAYGVSGYRLSVNGLQVGRLGNRVDQNDDGADRGKEAAQAGLNLGVALHTEAGHVHAENVKLLDEFSRSVDESEADLTRLLRNNFTLSKHLLLERLIVSSTTKL